MKYMSEKLKKFDTSNIIIVKEMRDYSKDPYFIKKAEDARAFIEKHGLPESFKKKKK
jgi:hypothetical protein